jgi:hypothetical protein
MRLSILAIRPGAAASFPVAATPEGVVAEAIMALSGDVAAPPKAVFGVVADVSAGAGCPRFNSFNCSRIN